MDEIDAAILFVKSTYFFPVSTENYVAGADTSITSDFWQTLVYHHLELPTKAKVKSQLYLLVSGRA